MGQALYRKYRSKSFADVVGQDHITKTLQNAIKTGKVSHAYLFTGPRGIGKTSVARILAHEVNNLPYSDESIHLDIIEIDAASNRRIDEIRDLRDKVNITPAVAKYKVYIIDEVHMLTREAFNALLKTLEEPPAHCIFILATTEVHKLPETIISRTQRFEFKPVTKAEATDHLSDLAKQEKIDIDGAALELLAEFGNGSFRDSISYLDQLSTLGQKITVEDVRQLLGLPSEQAVSSLIKAIEAGDSARLLEGLKMAEQHGATPSTLAAALANQVRQIIIGGKAGSQYYQLAKDLVNISTSPRPQDLLEIILFEACDSADKSRSTVAELNKNSDKPAIQSPETKIVLEAKSIISPQSKTPVFSLEQWPIIIERAKNEAASIYTALRLARPAFEDGVLLLSFQFPLHQKKLEQASNKQLVAKLVEEVSGQRIKIESIVDKVKEADFIGRSESGSPLNAINNIFGNSEVLEA
jgi:DNA polymerase-3 subunit gamma/tau